MESSKVKLKIIVVYVLREIKKCTENVYKIQSLPELSILNNVKKMNCCFTDKKVLDTLEELGKFKGQVRKIQLSEKLS